MISSTNSTNNKLEELESENKILWQLLRSRNKLIEDLLAKLPMNNAIFLKALEMRDNNFKQDKEIWGH